MIPNPQPEIATNREGETVGEALSGFITYAADAFKGGAGLDVATAYFNLGGYAILADALDRVEGARLLLGAEPTPPERRPRALGRESAFPDRAARTRLKTALDGHQQALTIDRDLLGFTPQTDAASRRLVEWLRTDKVQVRRLEKGFLHGKAFLVSNPSHGVVAGSSNFTYAGLTTNIELNLGNYQPSVVRQVRQWFEELWEEAEDYDLAALFEARFKPHPPQLIYLRMLWERYGAEILQESDDAGQPQIHLTSFQRDGLWRAGRILERYNGVLIADEVGLGKTFLAGELIREAASDRRQRVLVVAPATLRDGPWRAFKSQFNINMEIRSFDELADDRRLNPQHATAIKLEAPSINDYAMVVIDEAHNLRNPSTQRAEALRRLMEGSPPKKLALLTATPVNNSLWDLYYQLGYFLHNDAIFAELGIKSMRDHFHRAMALGPDDLSPEHLFDVLDAVAVRRTRSFVKTYYPNDTVQIAGRETTITFPTPRVRKITYRLDTVLPGFFDRFQYALDPPDDAPAEDRNILTMARYLPSLYRIDADVDAHEAQLAGLLRSGLLKRFESSPHAFANTCETMADTHDAFLSLLDDHGLVGSGDVLVQLVAADSDEIDELIGSLSGDSIHAEDASGYHVAKLASRVRQDRDLLRRFAAEARKVTRRSDPTLAKLVDQLAEISARAEEQGIGASDVANRRKVLVFSYYADTVDWIFEHLVEITRSDPRLAGYRGRIASLSGRAKSGDKEDVLWGFAPLTTDPPEGQDTDLYDIVVTTDVLSEGVNLQQAGHIINYDLPWNPMRLVQRHGRIDRIGSYHKEVFLHCVFPDDRLEDLLGLEERLHIKIKQAAASVGVGVIMPDQGTPVDITFTETRQEIERLRREEADLFDRGGTVRGALSGEEYRQELRQAMEDRHLAARIERLPWGSGSGMAAPPGTRRGYVFCARVADTAQPKFRFVQADPFTTEQTARSSGEEQARGVLVDDNTLACLHRARPPRGFDESRTLDDHTHRNVFEAWEAARADIVEKWNHLSDKANLEPRVPRALRDAAHVVRENPPPGVTQDKIERALDTLGAPYPERIVRTFRNILSSSDDPARQARSILETIDTQGLQPYIPPQPLPEITPDDVHLVCWLALT